MGAVGESLVVDRRRYLTCLIHAIEQFNGESGELKLSFQDGKDTCFMKTTSGIVEDIPLQTHVCNPYKVIPKEEVVRRLSFALRRAMGWGSVCVELDLGVVAKVKWFANEDLKMRMVKNYK